MSTQNAINSDDPIEVARGGTGLATITGGAVLIGSGTNAITPLAVGALGTLLVGTTADPEFDSEGKADFTFTSSTAGVTRTLKIENTNNTSTSSAARLDISVAGSSAGDPKINYIVASSQTWSQGIDNSDSDSYKIAANAALETTTVFKATTDGEITMPLQPAFCAQGNEQTDVTGDGTTYTVTFTQAEHFDQNADFDGTSTFTAPVTGKYQLSSEVAFDNLLSTHTEAYITLSTSNRDYSVGYINAANARTATSDVASVGFSLIADMDASDTAVVKVTVSNGTKTVEITGPNNNTYFSGFLAC